MICVFDSSYGDWKGRGAVLVAVTCRGAEARARRHSSFASLTSSRRFLHLHFHFHLCSEDVRRRTHTSSTMSVALITNVDQKLLRKTKFPPEFDQKVNMEKVNVPVIKKWVADEVARILNNDDDIVTELIYNVLEESPYVGGLQASRDMFYKKCSEANAFGSRKSKSCRS
jgi:hypothetical protein